MSKCSINNTHTVYRLISDTNMIMLVTIEAYKLVRKLTHNTQVALEHIIS